MKTKLLEAMAYGTSIVSTRAGVIGFENVKTIKVANTSKSFAKAIISILTSDSKDEKEIDKTRLLIKKKYTWNKIGNDLNDIIDSLEETIENNASNSNV